MGELVSIIIPVYNLGEYIAKSLLFILNQSYSNLEIVLVDDGSKDNTLELCHAFATMDQRIRVIHQENGGVSVARNTGIDNAHGEYIAFIDGDDSVAPFYIERLLHAVQGNVLSMCLHERVRSYEYNFADELVPFGVFSAEECAKRVISGDFPVGVWGAIFSRSCIGDLRFPAGVRNNEDKYFLYHYLLNNEKGQVAFTNQKMYGYYVREGSATRSTWNGPGDTIVMADRMHELTLALHPEWQSMSLDNKVAARLNELKLIIMSGNHSNDAKEAYREIKEQILQIGISPQAGKTMRIEYRILRLGDPYYKALVHAYYGLMSEQRRDQRNEKVSRQ